MCKSQAFQVFIETRVSPDSDNGDIAYFDEVSSTSNSNSRRRRKRRSNTSNSRSSSSINGFNRTNRRIRKAVYVTFNILQTEKIFF